jgi:hypothetical protein
MKQDLLDDIVTLYPEKEEATIKIEHYRTGEIRMLTIPCPKQFTKEDIMNVLLRCFTLLELWRKASPMEAQKC